MLTTEYSLVNSYQSLSASNFNILCNVSVPRENALSLSSPLRAGIMDLFNSPHLQVFHGVVRLTEMHCNRLLGLLRPDVGAVTIHSYMEGVLGLYNIL